MPMTLRGEIANAQPAIVVRRADEAVKVEFDGGGESRVAKHGFTKTEQWQREVVGDLADESWKRAAAGEGRHLRPHSPTH